MPIAPNQKEKGPGSRELPEPQSSESNPSISQELNGTNDFPELIDSQEVSYYAHVAFEKFEFKQFSHRELRSSLGKKYQVDKALIISKDPPGLLEIWTRLGLIEYTLKKLPNGYNQVTCWFISKPPMIEIMAEDIDPKEYEEFVDSFIPTNTGRETLQTFVGNLLRIVLQKKINIKGVDTWSYYFNKKKKEFTLPRSHGYLSEQLALTAAYKLLKRDWFCERMTFSDSWY